MLPDGSRMQIGEIAVSRVFQNGNRVVLENEDGSTGFLIGILGSSINEKWAGEIILPSGEPDECDCEYQNGQDYLTATKEENNGNVVYRCASCGKTINMKEEK